MSDANQDLALQALLQQVQQLQLQVGNLMQQNRQADNQEMTDDDVDQLDTPQWADIIKKKTTRCQQNGSEDPDHTLAESTKLAGLEVQ